MEEKIKCWYLQNKSFENFVCVENAFTSEECDQIKKYCNTLDKEQATIGVEEYKIDPIRKNIISWVEDQNETTEFLYRKLTDYVIRVNKEIWDFDLEYISTLQYTKYCSIGDKYDGHIDMMINGINYRKLSFSLQLDDENTYEGCELVIKTCDDPRYQTIASKKKGSLNFFPSFILHQVTPLLKGERNCLVGWVCGPSFK